MHTVNCMYSIMTDAQKCLRIVITVRKIHNFNKGTFFYPWALIIWSESVDVIILSN